LASAVENRGDCASALYTAMEMEGRDWQTQNKVSCKTLHNVCAFLSGWAGGRVTRPVRVHLAGEDICVFSVCLSTGEVSVWSSGASDGLYVSVCQHQNKPSPVTHYSHDAEPTEKGGACTREK